MTNLTLPATSPVPYTQPSVPSSPGHLLAGSTQRQVPLGSCLAWTGPASSSSLRSLGPSSSTSYLAPLRWQNQGIQRCWEAERGLLSPACSWWRLAAASRIHRRPPPSVLLHALLQPLQIVHISLVHGKTEDLWDLKRMHQPLGREQSPVSDYD